MNHRHGTPGHRLPAVPAGISICRIGCIPNVLVGCLAGKVKGIREVSNPRPRAHHLGFGASRLFGDGRLKSAPAPRSWPSAAPETAARQWQSSKPVVTGTSGPHRVGPYLTSEAGRVPFVGTEPTPTISI